jgi:tetratricopeptide (TPR) repeat protein
MSSLLALVLLVSVQEASQRAGVEAYRTGDYAKAAGHFEESIRQKETADAWANLGHARAALRENGAARKAYERALVLGTTERSRVSLGLGRVLLLDNDAAEAILTLAPALDAPDTAADGWLLLGQAREALGQRGMAVDAYRQASARLPKNVQLRARLGQLLLDLSRGAEALEVIRTLVDESPENPDWRLLRAQAALPPALPCRVFSAANEHAESAAPGEPGEPGEPGGVFVARNTATQSRC